MSVIEGEDKPLRYPMPLKPAHAVITSKIDDVEIVGLKWDKAPYHLCLFAPQAVIF